MERERGLFVVGDAIGSRADSAGTAGWLRALAAELDEAGGDARLASWEFTRGDEVRGFLRPDADPLAAVLRAALADEARPMRWALAWGDVEHVPGAGPASELQGPVVAVAEAAVAEAKRRRERLVVRTGDGEADSLLAGMVPALMDMLGELTRTQRHVARLAIIEGLRQSEVAARLHVRRATISVSFARSRVTTLEGLAGSIRAICARAAVTLPPMQPATAEVVPALSARG